MFLSVPGGRPCRMVGQAAGRSLAETGRDRQRQAELGRARQPGRGRHSTRPEAARARPGQLASQPASQSQSHTARQEPDSQPASQPEPHSQARARQRARQTQAVSLAQAEPGSRPVGQSQTARQSSTARQLGPARQPSSANQSCCCQESAVWPVRPGQVTQSQTVAQAWTGSRPESA